MHGLDNWIMGIHDPNAPFNQEDWTETFNNVLDKCESITDKMIDDNWEEYCELMSEAYDECVGDTYIPRSKRYLYIRENSEKIAELFIQKINSTIIA